MDEFSKKRFIAETKKTLFNNDITAMDLAHEFGNRVGYAVNHGIPQDVAIELCCHHFKTMGRLMLDNADAFAYELRKHQIKTNDKT